MFFYVAKTPNEQNLPIFNSDCQNAILLDKIKGSLNLVEHDIIDIVDTRTKECFMLHTFPKGYASQFIQTGETYALCSVKIEKIKLDEEELKKKKKNSKIAESIVNGYEIRTSFLPVETIDPANVFDFSKVIPINVSNGGRKSKAK
jgi:hypothetical protein